MRRRISWADALLVRLACWCRDHMTTPTAYFFDLETYERMGRLAEEDAAHAGRGGAQGEEG